jgi:hypothetical protein
MSLVWHLVLTTADEVPWVVAVALLAMLTAAANDAWTWWATSGR